MSFLRWLALKAVIAAMKPSVMAAAGALQHGVCCHDGANKMIKSIQYFAEADTTWVRPGPQGSLPKRLQARNDVQLGTARPRAGHGLFTMVHGVHYAPHAPRRLISTHPRQQRNRPGVPALTMPVRSDGRAYITCYPHGNQKQTRRWSQTVGLPERLVHLDQTTTHPSSNRAHFQRHPHHQP